MENQTINGHGLPCRSLFALGFYWWRGDKDEPWQVVEVFKQGDKLLVGRIARGKCCELWERGGQWGAMIPQRSFVECLKACALNMTGAVLACIEAPLSWAFWRIQRGRQSYPIQKQANASLAYPFRSVFASWIGLDAVLPYGQCLHKDYQEGLAGPDSCILANDTVETRAPQDSNPTKDHA